ncbi:response regulator transcription factor [Glaciecola sp. 2405UD65-10]|uniref:response regulator transcription factor n=1 Tax=Glaciecola sp. 2405UD65-10 TaxID=3397244 RepID=UPI003B596849
MTKAHVLIVEDNLDIAETLQLYLTQAKFKSTHLSQGKNVLSTIENKDVNLVLLDLMLPDCDGVSLCKKIRMMSKVPLIMLTAKTQEQDVINGLNSGADDYICKPFRSNEVIARVQSMLRRTMNFHSLNQLIFDELILGVESRTLTIKQTPVNLTKSEFLILEFLLKKRGCVVTREQIIENVFDHTYSASDRAIDSHLYNLRKKINYDRQYIQTVHGIGYKMCDRGVKA